jgi:hypothetical protein
MSITSRLRGCVAVRGCTAARQPCTAVRKRRTAARSRARLRAAVRDGCGDSRAASCAASLSSKLKLCIHSRVPTEGGRGRAAAQAAARGAAGRAPRRVRPNCLRCDRHRRALFGEKASKPKNRRAPAWPQDGRAAGEMAARLHSHGW